jgi:predicted transposase/invertase (TIGR01784 family)
MVRSRLVQFDWAIKFLLRNKANFDILEGFLSELLKTEIKIETILESESNKNHAEDKYNRVDVLVKTVQDRYIIVEVQCSSQWDYLSRILYGTSKMVCEYLDKGKPYKNISKIISVSIVFFDLGSGKDYLYHGSTLFKGLHYHDTLVLNPNEQQLYKTIHPAIDSQTPEHIFPEYYIIKVTQFKERVQDKIDEWIYFLKHGEIKEEFSARGIQSAANKLDVLRLSPEERQIYDSYKEASHDDASFNDMLEIVGARREAIGETRGEARGEAIGQARGEVIGEARGEAIGEARGEAIGQAKARRDMARSLKSAGMSVVEIITHTQLSAEEIADL